MRTRRARGGVEDRWTKADGSPSAAHGTAKRWRARYVDDRGREFAKGFARKVDATRWLAQQQAAVVDGRHVTPADAQITVEQWCGTWFAGYQGHRPKTVSNTRASVARIVAEFGDQPLSTIRPSMVKAWVVKLQAEGLAPGTVHKLHGVLSQILGDAVHDNVLASNPCSRRTSPPMGKPKMYVATEEQVWALHDAMPEHLRPAILLGAFAGLRISEAIGLRVADVDFMRGVVLPVQQPGGAPLKTAGSSAPVQIPRELANLLSASVARYGTDMMVTNGRGGCFKDRNALGRVVAHARQQVDGLPEGFSFHDLRHFFASSLIASGINVKRVQAQMRHATAAMTLDVYGHLMPDDDDGLTRAAIGKIIAERQAR